MKEKTKFYKCPICGNIVEIVDGDMRRVTCCGKPMEEMVANTTDAAVEKHVPIYEKQGDELIVKVGEVEHPMTEEHYIMWIAQVTLNQTTKVALSLDQKPEAKFPYIAGSTIYAYCNKHGLWKTTVK